MAFYEEDLNFVIGIIGDNGSGKTTVAEKIARKWKAERGGGYSIIAFDPQKRFEKIADYFIVPGDEDWAVHLSKFRNGLIILDDYRLLNKTHLPARGLERLLIERRNWNLDIIYICHNPCVVINYLTFFTNRYYILYTNSREGQFEKKIPNYTLCVAAARKVNNHVAIFGGGKFPNFAHCIVDIKRKKVFAVNMSKNIPNNGKTRGKLQRSGGAG